MIFKGIGLNIVTPFSETSEIDFESLDRMLDINIKERINAVVLGRNTGEFHTMSDDEIVSLIKAVAEKTAGKIPVIVQTGFNDTRRSIELSIKAKMAGASALILPPPYCNKSNHRGMVNHFRSVALASQLPCYIENDPETYGFEIDIEIIRELSEVPNIIGIIEGTDDMNRFVHLSESVPEDFEIVSAGDINVIPATAMGATGIISVFANIFPDVAVSIFENCERGNYREALKIQKEYVRFLDVLNIEENPIPVKTALNMLGYNVGEFRMPLHTMNADDAAKLATLIMDMGVKRI